MTERVFVLGAGRAGRGLTRALRASGVDVVGLHGTRAEPADAASGVGVGISAGSLPESLARADIVLVTVRDAQLDAALDQLAAAEDLPRHTIVLHASGATEPAALERLRAAGHACGTFHPLVPLADADRAAEALRGAWIGVDGDATARAAAHALAARLGARAIDIPAGGKPRYHAAAVFAANFPTVLAALAVDLMRDAGIAGEPAREAVLSLMRAAVANLQHRDPARALTGPVARGDAETVQRHLDALAADPAALAAYRVLSAIALELAREAGTDPQRLDRILGALGGEEIEAEQGGGE
ncbi:MAG TPA: DUF2520 domain-containing protein [Gemmatimonadaceae bacterium]